MIHIEGIASQDMSYLTKYFVFIHNHFKTTNVIPSFDGEWAYINKFGEIRLIHGGILVVGECFNIFPLTIILPEGVELLKNKIIEWSVVKDKMMKLQEEDAKIKAFFDDFKPIE